MRAKASLAAAAMKTRMIAWLRTHPDATVEDATAYLNRLDADRKTTDIQSKLNL